VVTAIKSAGTNHGFAAQDPKDAAWAGIYVYVGNAAVAVAEGDLVSVTGSFATFRGLEQVNTTTTGGAVVKVGTGSVPAPVVVKLEDVTKEGPRLQSMLVRLENVVALTATTGTEFRIGASVGVPPEDQLVVTSYLANDVGPAPFTAAAGQTFSAIQGIVDAYGPANGKTYPRLAPRRPGDLEAP
jgi:predicted extracellular nuclease